jgi:hypothetical protein
MEANKTLVILVLLLIILVLFVDQIGAKETFFNSNEEPITFGTILEINYHVFLDYVPDIKGIKYYNYLTRNNILKDFNSEISQGKPKKCSLIEDSIEKNLTYHFTTLKDKINTKEAIKNEINSTALILYNLKRKDIENNQNARDILKFTLINMLDHYNLDKNNRPTVNIVFLPFLLYDETLLELEYYNKRIYFIGLYKPSDNSIFLNNVPRWSNNEDNISKVKDLIYNGKGLFISVRFHDQWLDGLDKKCEFLSKDCVAGTECRRLNKIMKTNINNNYDQEFAYSDYLLDIERERNKRRYFGNDRQNNSDESDNNLCPLNESGEEIENSSRELINTFSFI